MHTDKINIHETSIEISKTLFVQFVSDLDMEYEYDTKNDTVKEVFNNYTDANLNKQIPFNIWIKSFE